MKRYQQHPNSASPPFFSSLPIIILCLAYIPTILSISTINSCPIYGQTTCGAGMPPEFCCPRGQKCIALAGNTTAICCPAGKICSSITPISCDIQKQNVTANPDSAIKTIALNSSMTKCGTMCCPFGFICNSVDICTMNTKQTFLPNSIPPIVIQPKTISASTIFFSPQVTASSSTMLSTTSSISMITPTIVPASTERTRKRFSLTSIILGFFPGLVIGGLIIVVVFYIRKFYIKKKREAKGTRSIKHISAPQPINDVRTDFLGIYASKSPAVFRETSPFDKSDAYTQEVSIYKMPSNSSLDLDEVLKTPLPPVPLNIRKQAPSVPPNHLSGTDSNRMNSFMNVSYSFENKPIIQISSARELDHIPQNLEDLQDYQRGNLLLADKLRNPRESYVYKGAPF